MALGVPHNSLSAASSHQKCAINLITPLLNSKYPGHIFLRLWASLRGYCRSTGLVAPKAALNGENGHTGLARASAGMDDRAYASRRQRLMYR